MRPFTVLLCVFLFSSCAKKLMPLTPATEINSMAYFTPLSYIYYIEKGNKAQLSDSLSKESAQQLNAVLLKNREVLRLEHEILLAEDSLRTKVEVELVQLRNELYKNKKLDGIALTPTIASILAQQEQRFTSLTIVSGFGRRKGNYGGQVAKGLAVGLLTLGAYTPVPVKNSLALTTFIFDKEKKAIAYYNSSLPLEKDPTDPQWIEKSLLKLHKGYLLN